MDVFGEVLLYDYEVSYKASQPASQRASQRPSQPVRDVPPFSLSAFFCFSFFLCFSFNFFFPLLFSLLFFFFPSLCLESKAAVEQISFLDCLSC